MATLRFLVETCGPTVSDVRHIGEGAWSQAYAFRLDGIERVIRWSAFCDNFERDAFAGRFSCDVLPIPEIETLGQHGNHFYAISRFVAGNYLETLSAPELKTTLPSLLGMFRALRSVDLSGTSGYGIWDQHGHAAHTSWQAVLLDDKDDSAGSLIKGWRGKLASSPLGMDAFNRLWARLELLVSRCPNERRLVHSDLLNRNVLAANGRVTALLDWGSSIFGDALYDIAWIVYCERWYPQFEEIDLAGHLLDDFRSDPRVNALDIEARLQCYLVHIGLDSIAYNAFQQDWTHAQEAADYTQSLLGRRSGAS